MLVVIVVFLCQYFSEYNCQNYTFINDEIRCSKEYVLNKKDYIVLKSELIEYLEKQNNVNKVTRYSVYFRDLDNGPIFGINDREKFVPASLLKIPVMITYFKLAEENPSLLKEEITPSWDRDVIIDQYYKPSYSIEKNKTYSIEELIEYMISYSDNISYFVLLEKLKGLDPTAELYLDTYKELGIINPTSNLDETIYTKAYASLFRTLYNASYLSKELSEKALEILAKSDFKDGLVLGVPSDIKISHKFGERYIPSENRKELHDCGVIYYPENPYLLCVMVEGYNFNDLSNIISTISKMVYKEVDSRKL